MPPPPCRSCSAASTVTIEPLLRDEMTVVARADHPLAGTPDLALGGLAACRWILPWRSSVSRGLFEARFEEVGLPPPCRRCRRPTCR